MDTALTQVSQPDQWVPVTLRCLRTPRAGGGQESSVLGGPRLVLRSCYLLGTGALSSPPGEWASALPTIKGTGVTAAFLNTHLWVHSAPPAHSNTTKERGVHRASSFTGSRHQDPLMTGKVPPRV